MKFSSANFTGIVCGIKNALQLAAAGFHMALCDRDIDGLEKTRCSLFIFSYNK